MGSTLSNCNLSCVLHTSPLISFLILSTLISLSVSTLVAIIHKISSLYKYVLKALHEGHYRSMRKHDCITHNIHSMYWSLTCHYSSWYTPVELIIPYPVLRASRQICGLQWDGNNDSLSVFDGFWQSLGFEQRETVTALSLLLLKQPPLITPSVSHIQDSHGILSRFPLKGEERRIFLL